MELYGARRPGARATLPEQSNTGCISTCARRAPLSNTRGLLECACCLYLSCSALLNPAASLVRLLALSLLDTRVRSQGTAFEDRFYEMRVGCGDSYPVLPPTVRFVSRVNLGCVNQVTSANGRDTSERPSQKELCMFQAR